METETARPLIIRPGYLIIKAASPATLRVVSDDTVGSRLEDVFYFDKNARPLVIREEVSMTV